MKEGLILGCGWLTAMWLYVPLCRPYRVLELQAKGVHVAGLATCTRTS